jgi:hypothetical protein
MRGTMVWFNEDRGVGVIDAATGTRLRVSRDDFVMGPPEGRCGGVPVTFEVGADGQRAERVVLVEEAIPRRARRRSAGHR